MQICFLIGVVLLQLYFSFLSGSDGLCAVSAIRRLSHLSRLDHKHSVHLRAHAQRDMGSRRGVGRRPL